MKSMCFVLIILGAVSLLAAVDVTLHNGKVYSGVITEAVGGVVVMMDESVLIRIPAEEIKSVNEGSKDLSAEILKNALSPTNLDSHYLTREDYFVSDRELGNKEWIRVSVAKMLTPASATTNQQAEFLSAQSGSSIWSQYYYKTRVAAKEELIPGTMVICLDTMDNGIYRSPKDNSEARNAAWWLSRITDNSEIFKGYVIVGANYKVALNAIRIVIK